MMGEVMSGGPGRDWLRNLRYHIRALTITNIWVTMLDLPVSYIEPVFRPPSEGRSFICR